MPTQYVPQQLPVEVQQTPPQHCCVEVHGYSSASVQHCVVALTQEPAHSTPNADKAKMEVRKFIAPPASRLRLDEASLVHAAGRLCPP
eukprot:5750540-Prymnesium_polylepis.1